MLFFLSLFSKSTALVIIVLQHYSHTRKRKLRDTLLYSRTRTLMLAGGGCSSIPIEIRLQFVEIKCHAMLGNRNETLSQFHSIQFLKQSQCVIAASETTVVNFIILLKGWYRLRTGGVKATTIFVVFGFYTSTKKSSSINKWSLQLIFVIILYKSINCAARYKRGFYDANIFIFNIGCSWLYFFCSRWITMILVAIDS